MALDTPPFTWMPPSLSDDEKQAWSDANPNDGHAAAAGAWESYAATLPAEPVVAAVSTGAQSVQYRGGGTDAAAAMERANWHRARSRAASVNVSEAYGYGWEADERTIDVYDAPAVGRGSDLFRIDTTDIGPEEDDE